MALRLTMRQLIRTYLLIPNNSVWNRELAKPLGGLFIYRKFVPTPPDDKRGIESLARNLHFPCIFQLRPPSNLLSAASSSVFRVLFQASQASDVGSIPIARSINPVDAVGFTDFHPRNWPIKSGILDAVGRESRLKDLIG